MASIARKVMLLLLITMLSTVLGCAGASGTITAPNEIGEEPASVMPPANAADDQARTLSGASDGSYTVDISKSIIAILLPSDAVSGDEWTYTAKGEGEVSEASWDEYQEQEMAYLESEGEDDGMFLMPEGIPHGSAAFVSKA